MPDWGIPFDKLRTGLAYASSKGRAFLDRELYLPEEWVAAWDRRQEAGVPDAVNFQTKPQLARAMLERALERGVPFAWVVGDEVYGSDRCLRVWLEQQEIAHVLAVKSNEPLWAGPRQIRAARLAAQVPAEEWVRLSAGEGAKGPRYYHWIRVPIRPLGMPGKGYWLLARRSMAKPDELAYYVCFGPAGTTLEELVRVAGTRWAIEESFEAAKSQVGLDQYEVRRWVGWYRHITLVLLAHAFLAVTIWQAATAAPGTQQGEV